MGLKMTGWELRIELVQTVVNLRFLYNKIGFKTSLALYEKNLEVMICSWEFLSEGLLSPNKLTPNSKNVVKAEYFLILFYPTKLLTVITQLWS